MEGRKERGFRELLVWRQAMDLARDCYFLTKSFPKEELYGLTSQIRRAAVSVPANIAEGNGRGTRKDYVSFLRIAQGSLRELETYLILIVEIGLVRQEAVAPLSAQVNSVARLLNRLIQSLLPNP
ncbi:MAG: four helix bundle protein [Deltaproteobacteria bacterium]|nr:four helix bundle protein [Deltaproteobacteria bacterium]